MSDIELALPATKSKIAKMGMRLVAGTASAGDWSLYGAVLDVYDRAQVEARNRLDQVDWLAVVGRDLDMAVSGRAKTLDTLTQKLERTPGIKLPYIRDIAGVRLVGDITISEQDLVAAHCMVLFDCPDAQVVDRRADPEAGYRALHVVVTVGQIPVEVQIRTHLQGLWADLFERIADTWGRQIRYGQDPDPGPADSSPGNNGPTRTEAVAALQVLSMVGIRQVEELVDMAATADALILSPPLSSLAPEEAVPADLGARIDGVETYGDLVAHLAALRARVIASRAQLEGAVLQMADLVEPHHPIASPANRLDCMKERS